MKNLMLFLVMALMTAGAPQSGESLGTRYTEFSERVSVTVDHDIFIDGTDLAAESERIRRQIREAKARRKEGAGATPFRSGSTDQERGAPPNN